MARRGTDALRAAKEGASGDRSPLRLPVGSPVAGSLRPVATRPGAVSQADIRSITEWRNRFVTSFLSEFVATEERTERWLVETVGPDDTRILFMLDAADGRTVGHMGLAFIDWEAGYAEVDAVVRGAEAPAGLVSKALGALWGWARTDLGLSQLWARVRSDNSAIAFYEKAGFRELRRVPLRRREVDDGVRWIEEPSAAAGDLSVVHMRLENDGS